LEANVWSFIRTARAEAGGLLASPTCPPNGPSNTKFSVFPSNSAPHSNQTHLALEVVVPCRTIGLQYRLLAFRRTKYFWPQQGRSYASGARFESCQLHHALSHERRFPEQTRKARNWRAFFSVIGLCDSAARTQARFSAVCLCAEIRVSQETETGSTETRFDGH
jgi:hypothetical protein